MTVSNAAPVVDPVADQTILLDNMPFVLPTVVFTDMGTLDTHTALINWGDGTQEPGTVTESPFGPPGDPAGMSGTVSGSHSYAAAGLYNVEVTVTDDDWGEDTIDFWVNVINREVVDRHIFYNNSAWDGNDPAANASDDNAIAPHPSILDATDPTYPGNQPKELGKEALLRGGTATFANYTSYARGINGIMIDIRGLDVAPTASDFEFRVGNNNDPGSWRVLTPSEQPSVTLRPVPGASDVGRVTLIWPDHTIEKEWLQVRVLASGIGLAEDDVFYFGNAVGDSGNSTLETNVDMNDQIGAWNHPHSAFSPAPIEDAYDYDRDKKVDMNDQILAFNNPTSAFTRLHLITVPGPVLIESDGSTAVATENRSPTQQVASGALHDAVLEQESGRLDAPDEDLWMYYAIEEMNLRNRSPDKSDPAEKAVDEFLMEYWP